MGVGHGESKQTGKSKESRTPKGPSLVQRIEALEAADMASLTKSVAALWGTLDEFSRKGDVDSQVVASAAKEAMYDPHFRDRIAQLAVREGMSLARATISDAMRVQAENQVRDFLRSVDFGPLLEKVTAAMVQKIVANIDFRGRTMEQRTTDRVLNAVQDRIRGDM